MGECARAVIKSGKKNIYLYTHWQGSKLPGLVKAAMARVPGQWADPGYLARAIFCQMIATHGELLEETGFGISAEPMEDTSRDVIVDCDTQTVKLPRRPTVTFSQYVGG